MTVLASVHEWGNKVARINGNLTISNNLLQVSQYENSGPNEEITQQDISLVGILGPDCISPSILADLCCECRRNRYLVDMVSRVSLFWLVVNNIFNICCGKHLPLAAISKSNIFRHIFGWRNIIFVLQRSRFQCFGSNSKTRHGSTNHHWRYCWCNRAIRLCEEI